MRLVNRTSTREMADAGDLGKLPPEIRKDIYAHLLVEPKAIPVKRYLYKDEDESKFDEYHTRGLFDRKSRMRRANSILRVNKLINEEATQVMYSCNRFMFQNAGALRLFLEQIGGSKGHLRHVGISEHGYKFMGSWKAMDVSITMLASSSRGLRTLEVSHLAFCHRHKRMLQIKDLVQHCKPLLQALHDEFVEENLNASVFDVIDICLTCSNVELNNSSEQFAAHPNYVHITDYTTVSGVASSARLCGCACSVAEKVNNNLRQGLKEEIAKQLELQFI